MKNLVLILLFIITVTGCSHREVKSNSSYPSAVAWNNILFGLSSQEVPIQDVGMEIGKIERKSTPMPKKNGEANEKPIGSLLFEIKGTDSQDVIAVKVHEKYIRASKLGPLE